jgi:hypothetical protein
MVISMTPKHGPISQDTPSNFSFNFCHLSAVNLAKIPGAISMSVILHPYLKFGG